jgi:myo-inositol-1-phosphate synthase
LSGSAEHDPPAAQRRVGAWLVGARGSIATCVAYGLAGLREGLVDPVGLVSDTRPFHALGLVSWEELVLGGHDVCRRALTRSAGELVASRILPGDVVAAVSPAAAAYESRIRPGVLDGPDVGVADLEPDSARLGGAPPREQIEAITEDLRAFAASRELDRVVVVNVASTEARRRAQPEWASLAAFEEALDAGVPQPASCVYAYAALRAGCPHVNFTPNLGAAIPALRELALEVGVPHCGNDGKTGETLVKTTLAPMFKARALRVLSWQGYNMLGNRDGAALADPVRRESKVRNKDDALRAILDDDEMHTHVGIDYVPSLGDWKTAWDFVHFEGFLGARMSLQFTWQGSDSALAAPLVLDLVRFADLAAERGESGAMEAVAAYFKSPLAGGTHDFHAQFERLRAWAERR